MKRFLSLVLCMFMAAGLVFADDGGDEYEDDYVYEQNGAGDQFLKINIGACFPLNFGNKLYPGIAAEVGYYKFLNKYFALGGEFLITDNITIGSKALFMIPITVGAIYQPVIGKFEFPVSLLAGLGTENLSGSSYWPSLIVKPGVGVYYRFFENWSAGINASFMWVPQWFADSSKNVNGLFANITIGARYHF